MDDGNFKDNDSSYNSVINRVGEAVNESETLFEFIRKTMSIFYYTKIVTLFMIIVAIYHFTMIFTGNSSFIVSCEQFQN